MRTLKRNQRSFWYALYEGEQELTDEDGLYTGDIGPRYSEPVQRKANISASRGEAETELFGTDLRYSRTIATEDLDWPVTEESILWIGIEPEDENGNPVPHNYAVAGIARSLNSLMVAVREVQVS